MASELGLRFLNLNMIKKLVKYLEKYTEEGDSPVNGFFMIIENRFEKSIVKVCKLGKKKEAPSSKP